MKFYVYEHWRLDANACFYVGKGKGKRAWEFKQRNRHHKRIVAKLARAGLLVEVVFIADCLSEKAAFALEKARIAHWREKGVNLVNKTDGGEGTSGAVWEEDSCAKLSATVSGENNVMKRPGVVAKFKVSLSEAWARPGRKEEHSVIMKEALNNPVSRAKMRAAKAGRTRDPKACEKTSVTMKGVSKSPEHRANMIKAQQLRRAKEKSTRTQE